MNIIDIPFSEKVGIEKCPNGFLVLPYHEGILNHLKTIHASALYSLAEAASGEALQVCFPALVGKVIPVVRESQFKYKRPATKSITAYPRISDAAIEKFKNKFVRKGRSLITVDVEIKDVEDVVISVGSFTWFIQSMEAQFSAM